MVLSTIYRAGAGRVARTVLLKAHDQGPDSPSTAIAPHAKGREPGRETRRPAWCSPGTASSARVIAEGHGPASCRRPRASRTTPRGPRGFPDRGVGPAGSRRWIAFAGCSRGPASPNWERRWAGGPGRSRCPTSGAGTSSRPDAGGVSGRAGAFRLHDRLRYRRVVRGAGEVGLGAGRSDRLFPLTAAHGCGKTDSAAPFGPLRPVSGPGDRCLLVRRNADDSVSATPGLRDHVSRLCGIASKQEDEELTAQGLIDTTEMYLRTIFELEEEGCRPAACAHCRAAGAERPDRQPDGGQDGSGMAWCTWPGTGTLTLSDHGRTLATRVMRKPQAGRMPAWVGIIKLPWEEGAHRGVPLGARDLGERGAPPARTARLPRSACPHGNLISRPGRTRAARRRRSTG